MTLLHSASAWPSATTSGLPVAASEWSGDPEADHASCGDVACELEQIGRRRGLGAVVLPRGIARDIPPLVDGRHVELAHLGAGLLIDLGDLDIVVLRALAAERFEFAADREDNVLLVLGQL